MRLFLQELNARLECFRKRRKPKPKPELVEFQWISPNLGWPRFLCLRRSSIISRSASARQNLGVRLLLVVSSSRLSLLLSSRSPARARGALRQARASIWWWTRWPTSNLGSRAERGVDSLSPLSKLSVKVRKLQSSSKFGRTTLYSWVLPHRCANVLVGHDTMDENVLFLSN